MNKYDSNLTMPEQLAELRKKLAFYLDNGHDGTSQVQAVRQRIADLEQHQSNVVAVQERARADLAAQSGANVGGGFRPAYCKKPVQE